jgi:hypothetical protein
MGHGLLGHGLLGHGLRQSGIPDMRFGSLLQPELVVRARRAAERALFGTTSIVTEAATMI